MGHREIGLAGGGIRSGAALVQEEVELLVLGREELVDEAVGEVTGPTGGGALPGQGGAVESDRLDDVPGLDLRVPVGEALQGVGVDVADVHL